MIGTQYSPTTFTSMSLSICSHFLLPCRNMITDSATLWPDEDALPSRTRFNNASATPRDRSSWPTVVERLARSKIVFPRSLSETLGSRIISKHTGRTKGMRRKWPAGHVAAMFTQSRMAASKSGRFSQVNVAKICLKLSAMLSKTSSTAWAPISELKAKSPRKFEAAAARSAPPNLMRRKAVATMPLSMARLTKSRRDSADS
mmetsp:Transcript_65460/g.140042  ORF Transcript_65460/g.140042 Transcript_65460/m.140042 type:complete len:202 (+) Transcript_65460:102-707(+)